jgi:hypothetical protein
MIAVLLILCSYSISRFISSPHWGSVKPLRRVDEIGLLFEASSAVEGVPGQ